MSLLRNPALVVLQGVLVLAALVASVDAQAVSGGCSAPCFVPGVLGRCSPAPVGTACTVNTGVAGTCRSGYCNPPTANTTLLGSNEVATPPVVTNTTGKFTAKQDAAGAWSWVLSVTKPANITMAHIHNNTAGANGPVIVWLLDFRTSPVSSTGTVTYGGKITTDFFTGGLAGQSMATLTQLMRDGRAYVNVHSSTYPSGVIRGQIEVRNG